MAPQFADHGADIGQQFIGQLERGLNRWVTGRRAVAVQRAQLQLERGELVAGPRDALRRWDRPSTCGK